MQLVLISAAGFVVVAALLFVALVGLWFLETIRSDGDHHPSDPGWRTIPTEHLRGRGGPRR